MEDIVIYTAQEIAAILKISEAQAYWMIRKGDLPAVRIGRRVRVLKEDLHDFIARNRQNRTPVL